MAKTNTVVTLPRTLAKKATASVPGSAVAKDSVIPRGRTNLQFEEVKTLRNTGRILEAIRKLATVDGTVSAAVYAMVQVADSGFTMKAYSSVTHEFDVIATDLARSVRASMDTLYDYTKGYADKRTFSDLIETGLRETILTGAIAGELVLNKTRLPDRINLIPYEQIEWKAKGDGTKFPVQTSTAGQIELNIPNFWVAESHIEANSAYSRSMLEASLSTVFYYLEFIEDMRRSVRRSGHTRMVVKLDAAKVRAAAPAEIHNDPTKMQIFMDSTLDEVKSVVNALEPEDALITYDSLEVEPVQANGEKQDYKDLLDTLSGILATSLKSHPSILGLRLTGSQSLSNTESLVFLKTVRAIQKPLEKLLSRAMTLAVRLYGADVYVKFRFNTIDIRPEQELEAFRVMRQARVLEQLSLGLITDEEAAEALGTGPLPPGHVPLSGTMFHQSTGAGMEDKVSPNADPMGRAIQSDAPKKAGGRVAVNSLCFPMIGMESIFDIGGCSGSDGIGFFREAAKVDEDVINPYVGCPLLCPLIP